MSLKSLPVLGLAGAALLIGAGAAQASMIWAYRGETLALCPDAESNAACLGDLTNEEIYRNFSDSVTPSLPRLAQTVEIDTDRLGHGVANMTFHATYDGGALSSLRIEDDFPAVAPAMTPAPAPSVAAAAAVFSPAPALPLAAAPSIAAAPAVAPAPVPALESYDAAISVSFIDMAASLAEASERVFIEMSFDENSDLVDWAFHDASFALISTSTGDRATRYIEYDERRGCDDCFGREGREFEYVSLAAGGWVPGVAAVPLPATGTMGLVAIAALGWISRRRTA